MTAAQKKALATYRRRLKRKGVSRMEVRVRKEDAPLIREVVKALSDPEREKTAREALRRAVTGKPKLGFKELLAAAPLEGIDLEREQDYGREIDL